MAVSVTPSFESMMRGVRDRWSSVAFRADACSIADMHDSQDPRRVQTRRPKGGEQVASSRMMGDNLSGSADWYLEQVTRRGVAIPPGVAVLDTAELDRVDAAALESMKRRPGRPR